MKFIKKYWSVLKSASKEFIDNDPTSKAATIAYYTIFSLPAVMIITITVAGAFYDQAEVRTALISQAGRMIGADTARSLQGMMENAEVTQTKFTSQVIGIIALIVSAGTVFASLQNTLNSVWKVEAVPGKAIWKYLSTRLISLALIATMGFLVLVSLVLDTVLAAIGTRMAYYFSEATSFVLTAANVLISFGVIVFIFATIFRVLPDVKVKWRDVLSGSVVTALLFTLGKFLIAAYISYAGLSDTYGAAGAVVIILVWVYYSTIILIFGAHFTYVYARDHGSGVKPAEQAVRVETVEMKVIQDDPKVTH